MFNRRVWLALTMALLMGSSAFAGGGGGTKKDATISVRNDTTGVIAAFVDPDPAKIAALPAVPTQAQIEAAGGKLINPKATVKFPVKAGTYVLAAGTNPTAPATATVVIGKGQTKKFAFSNLAGLAPY